MEGMRGDFYEEGIIIRRNDCACICGAGIETDARAAAGTVCNDLACVRHEVVLRIFGRNTTLDGNALEPDFTLLADADFRTFQRVAFCNQDLCLYDIDVRDHFSDGMFYLYTRIDFDEVEMLFILVDEEFNSACIDIIDILHQFDSCFIDLVAQALRKRPCRSHFNDLLMTALDGAVSFEKMNDMAVFITKNLDFDVLRVHDAFFYIDFIITECHLRFGTSAVVRFFQIFHPVDITHAASAAAIDSFDHDRQTVLLSKFLDFREIMDSALGTRNHRDACFFSLDAGIDLVAEHDEVFYVRSDECNAFFFAALSQFRIFSKEAVARMDSIYIVFLADADDIFNIQVSIDRLIASAYQVCFISAVSVQGQNIFLGINGYRADAKFPAGSERSNGDFASVCYQYFAYMFHRVLPRDQQKAEPSIPPDGLLCTG